MSSILCPASPTTPIQKGVSSSILFPASSRSNSVFAPSFEQSCRKLLCFRNASVAAVLLLTPWYSTTSWMGAYRPCTQGLVHNDSYPYKRTRTKGLVCSSGAFNRVPKDLYSRGLVSSSDAFKRTYILEQLTFSSGLHSRVIYILEDSPYVLDDLHSRGLTVRSRVTRTRTSAGRTSSSNSSAVVTTNCHNGISRGTVAVPQVLRNTYSYSCWCLLCPHP